MKSEGLKALERMTYEIKRRQYPNAPAHSIPKTVYSDATANGLTKCLLDYLKASGHKTWRQTSEGRYRPGQQVTDVLGHVRQMKGRFLPGTNTGAGDVTAIIRGLFCTWEVKVGKDRQSQKQKDYQQEVQASGGRYFICRTFDEFLMQYKSTII